VPPAGAHFSSEWGFRGLQTIRTTTGAWEEFNFDFVIEEIHRAAGNPDITDLSEKAEKLGREFSALKETIVSILTDAHSASPDPYIERMLREASEKDLWSESQFESQFLPRGEYFSRDTLAISGGLRPAPHQVVLAQLAAITHPVDSCRKLSDIARQSASHLSRVQKRKTKSSAIGTNAFIGHGRSPLWRELKDFVRDRVKLPFDEFNRVPVAGITNIARLSEMLDAAAIALVVLTAEDERIDGTVVARQNVVHEVGLFQGRLGFTRAIVLLEEGCEPFSNIEGLGQIRFPKGNISACFDEVRRVLEREGLIEA
jgi:predicted nucleotide-binding protein